MLVTVPTSDYIPSFLPSFLLGVTKTIIGTWGAKQPSDFIVTNITLRIFHFVFIFLSIPFSLPKTAPLPHPQTFHSRSLCFGFYPLALSDLTT